MTEHVHKWELCGDEYEHGYVCYGCTEVMGSDDPQIARCLNATERLKDQSRLWRHHEDCEPLSQEGCICGLWDARSGYADILEGKDE